MKFKGIYILSLTVVLFFISAYFPFFENGEKEKFIMQTMIQGLTELHFDPVSLDNNFSEQVYESYLDRLDGSKRWLIQQDIDKLAAYKVDLDDQIMQGNYTFLNLGIELLTKGIQKVKNYYPEILSKPFDFDKDENIVFKYEDINYPKDDKFLYNRWIKDLKFRTLTKILDKMEAQEANGELEKKSF